MYEHEDYYEPNEFYEEVDVLKHAIQGAVKKKIKDELDRLRKENAELRPYKDRLNELDCEYNRKKRTLEQEYEQLKRDAKRMAFSEMLEGTEVIFWDIASKAIEKPKCSRCDKERKRHFKYPSGKDGYEMCECNGNDYIYQPIEVPLYSIFKDDNYSGKIRPYYKIATYSSKEALQHAWSDTGYSSGSKDTKDLIESEDDFGQYRKYNSMFKTRELAQKYCDLKNREAEKSPEPKMEIGNERRPRPLF